MPPKRRPAAVKTRPRAAVKPPRRQSPLAAAKAKAKGKDQSGTRPQRRKRQDLGVQGFGTWQKLEDAEFKVGQQIHLKGTYKGQPAECVGEIEALVEDQEGPWLRLRLTGSSHQPLQEWRKSCQDEFYVNRKTLLKTINPGVEGLFCAREVNEVDPMLEWKSNLIELERQGQGLAGLEAVAQDLGYGIGQVGGLDPPPRRAAAEETPVKAKRLGGKARVRNMIKQSAWDWKGSALDPSFRRPRVNLKRKREESTSDSSASSRSREDSEQEDLFPEEGQARHIARKCPGLLARGAIKEARKRLTTELGENIKHSNPSPVFVKYYRQVFAHSGASTPMKREYLTLAMCLDAILEGNIMRCLDLGVQRMKSVEQISQGVPPQVANRLELILPETSALTSLEESRTAALEHRREDRIKTSWKGKGKGEAALNRTYGDDHWGKGEKGGKPQKGKDQKGKTSGKWRPGKGQPSQESEVVAVKG